LDLYRKYKPTEVAALRKDMIVEHLQRMVALYGYDTPDLPELTQIDNGIISGGVFNPKDLDSNFANQYSTMLMDQAKKCMAAKKYMKAESWLLQAIQFEERAKGSTMGSLCDCTQELYSECEKDPAMKKHLPEIAKLLQQAHSAEDAKLVPQTPVNGTQ
jgi:hypothetical protein